jgi:alkylation response protein AidB-like acyl-CoA dehydrogenase
MRGDFFGDTLVGPTLLQWGTEEQKREFLPGILGGTTSWCQGFSEPNSGSDLASLKTTAVLDGDEWVINGQKVWTTQGHHADYCFLLTRTDPEAPKHKGITYVLVPMKQDGIEVRGITQPDGTAEFCEVFFDDARAPKDNVVGGVNNGWKVANSTLAFERGQSATTGFRRFAEEYRIMVETAQDNGKIDDPLIRQRLMQYYTKIQILRVNGLRNLTATLNESKDLGTIALGATNKMFWSEMHKAAMELALDIFGAESMLVDGGPEAGGWPGSGRDKRRDGYPISPMLSAFFFSRSETFQRLQMQVYGAGANGAAARQRDLGPAIAGDQRSEHQDRGTHLAHDLVIRVLRGQVMRRHGQNPALLQPLNLGAERLQQRGHRLDVRQPRRIGQRQRLGRQQRRRHQREACVLGPRYGNFAAEFTSARDQDRIHFCRLSFSRPRPCAPWSAPCGAPDLLSALPSAATRGCRHPWRPWFSVICASFPLSTAGAAGGPDSACVERGMPLISRPLAAVAQW